MKNMKKLLGVMAALGFTAVAATNVVACSGSKGAITTNDLTKSFNSSYQALGFSGDAGYELLGLKGNPEKPNTYDFTATNLKESAVQTWVYANSSKAPINTKVVADVNSSLTPPTKSGVEAVQYSAKDQKGLVVQTDKAATVSFKITLTLFKSVANDANPTTFSYKATPTTMDITINVATNDIRQNLKDLKPITIAATDAGNVASFKNNLIQQIKTQTNFNNFSARDLGDIQNSDKTNFDIKNLVANDKSQKLDLFIITDKDSINFKTDDKTQAVSVTITKVNKVDISKITNSIKVTSPINEVADFTTAVYSELVKDVQYPALLQDVSKLSLTKDDKTALKDEDIVNNPNLKLVLTMANDSSYYSGTANITVNLIVTPINLSALQGKTFIVAKNVTAYDLNSFQTALVTVIKEDSTLKDFDTLATTDFDWSNLNVKDIVSNSKLSLTLTSSHNSKNFTGTATITVNLTVTQINLSKLKDVTLTGVKEKDLASFTTALVKEINNQKGYELLTKDDITIKHTKDKDLTADDIVTNKKLSILITAADKTNFTGTANINIDLTTTK